MRYCQGTKCHQYRTKDRIRGTKGNKSYQTRRRSEFYYGHNNFCSVSCTTDWLHQNIEHALNHLGRVTEAKKTMCDQAWYKDYSRSYNNNINGHSTFNHYFVNDLLGERIPITEQQYDNPQINNPKQIRE